MQMAAFAWLSVESANKHTAFCRVCERVFLLTMIRIKAVDAHMKSEKHRKSIATCDKKFSEENDFDSELLYVSVGDTIATLAAASLSKTYALHSRQLRRLKRNCCGNGGNVPIVTNTRAQWLGVGLVGHSVVKTVF